MAFEITSALISLAGAVVGGGISSITTLLIAKTERQKYRRERSWDLRREAYTTIIGALDRARAIAQYIDREYCNDPHGWDASEYNKKAQKELVEHFQTAREAFHANRLMLSKNFVAKYDEMNDALAEGGNPNLAPPETSEIATSVMQRIVPEMEQLAAKELGVSSTDYHPVQ
jgi:gas vesicle protein